MIRLLTRLSEGRANTNLSIDSFNLKHGKTHINKRLIILSSKYHFVSNQPNSEESRPNTVNSGVTFRPLLVTLPHCLHACTLTGASLISTKLLPHSPLLSSGCNPFVYAVFNNNYRREFVRMVGRRLVRPRRNNNAYVLPDSCLDIVNLHLNVVLLSVQNKISIESVSKPS